MPLVGLYVCRRVLIRALEAGWRGWWRHACLFFALLYFTDSVEGGFPLTLMRWPKKSTDPKRPSLFDGRKGGGGRSRSREAGRGWWKACLFKSFNFYG